MSIRKYLLLLCTAISVMAEDPTPYELLRPIFPLTWDSTVFNDFDTSSVITKKHNVLPTRLTPKEYVPNALIPDTLDQAYLDAMNVKISPIRVNQAGYLESDPERQFYYVGNETSFEVVDINGMPLSPAITGTLKPSGSTTSSKWTILAGTNAATADQQRYKVTTSGPSGKLMIGNIPQGVPTETRLRIKVGSNISSTFIISEKVYSMVKDAALKFYGINRSGHSDSWFRNRKMSHTKDGGGMVIEGPLDAGRGYFDASLAGTLEGGYYDCGDHLKESQTQMYAFMVMALMAAANSNVDADHYAFNQSITSNKDGIPDMLREAKHGADFVLRSFVRAKGVVDDMALSIGNSGTDHAWWGLPENHDYLPVGSSNIAKDRGGPASRPVRLGEVGANVGGETAAGLAFVGKMYKTFFPEYKAFADSCIMVAEKMYDFAKALVQGKDSYDGGKPFVHHGDSTDKNGERFVLAKPSPAYGGNNEFVDDMAIASVGLLYATGKKEYADDMIRAKNLYPKQIISQNGGPGFFEGGWFVTENQAFLKNTKNTSWANAYSYALYALYKLILADKTKATTEYGLTESEWQNAIEDCVANMIVNLGDMRFDEGVSETFQFPNVPNIWKNSSVTYDKIWYTMHTDQEWIYNRYRAGDIFEVLAYADVAADIEKKGIELPSMGSPNWKAAEAKQFGINQLNYLLGVNPWDISFIMGIGDKNDAHPHHRAANPEGKNVPGANYLYKVPVGALYGAVPPYKKMNMPEKLSWEYYEMSEICIDASATLVSTVSLASQKIDKEAAPDISVETRYVGVDSAIVTVKLTQRGTVILSYGTTEGLYNLTATDSIAGVQHDIYLHNLQPGTTYYFYVTAANAYKPENTKTKFRQDSTQTPYSFMTLPNLEDANIVNVTACNVTADSAEIMWYTPNGAYESKVYWDTVPHSTAAEFANNTGVGNADISGIPTQFHYVKIGGLKENTTYYYMVESNGVIVNTNDKGDLLKFKTPVTWYDFSVRGYQYIFDKMDFLNLNIYNNEARPFDSLTLRLYFTALPEEVERCATLIDSDICFAYDEGGFSVPCENDRELRDLMRSALPVRLDDTYDPATGKYSYYFPAPLGSTVIKSQSRLRIDFGFSYGISNDGYKTCETLRQPGKKRFSKNSGDWSWRPHSYMEDGADYEGMPVYDKEYGDLDVNVPIDPYIAVYRKDQFIWGFSPSKKEMETKRANYRMDLKLDPPFNLSNGSHIEIDQPSSTVHVKGRVKITEGGYVTKVWANGIKVSGMVYADGLDRWILNEAGTEIVAKYDIPTDEWILDIPVKMAIGSNKVDVTIFAGPDPTCDACTENGGCAFENRNFQVEFSKGNATASIIVLKDSTTGKPIISPANPEGTKFIIDLKDDDKKSTNTQTLEVQVINNKKNDILKATLTADPANPGHFVSEPITAISHSKESRNQTSEISFFAGDTIQVVYTDPKDEEDISKYSFYAESKTPSPQAAFAEDSNCDKKADQLRIVFTNKITEGWTLDSIRYIIEGMKDTVKVSLAGASYIDKSEVIIPIDTNLVQTNASPTGKITTYIAEKGAVNAETIKISDGIYPTIESVSILEKADDNSDYDTIMVAFSEPVILSSQSEWPLTIAGTAGAPTVVGKGSTTNNGKSWTFVITGNKNNSLVPIGAQASPRTSSGFTITDQSFNAIDVGCKPSVPITLISRPVPIYHAEMIDLEGDGIPDVVYMMFERKLKPKDVFDSIVTVWGNPGITRSFITTADTTGGIIKPKENYWTIRDSVSTPFTVQINDSTTKDSVNTYSIVEIKIPSKQAYPYGSTSGENDGNGTVSPLKGAINGFFETTYTLYDKCAPVISSARMFKEGLLTVNISEAVSMLNAGKYIQRERDEYIPPEKPQGSGKSYLFTYNEKDNVVHAGDRIRLVPDMLGSAFIDKNGNIPTTMNPYIRITGDDNIRFTVTQSKPVATPKPEAYMGRPDALAKDAFTTSAVVGGKHNFINGNGTIVGQVDTAAYIESGPSFEIEIMMPSASFMTHDGQPMYNFHLNIVTDFYDNLGQYINTYRLDIPKEKFSELRDLIDNGMLKLNVEWSAKDNVAPVAQKGNKIGTGAYIAKFDFTAESFCATKFDETNNDYKATCSEIGAKAKKATDSKTRTLGFKRKK